MLYDEATEALIRRMWPNPDGDDYEPDGKYYMYRGTLRSVRNSEVSEDTKLRRINQLKEEVIPFWHRCDEIPRKESEELMAVFMKYNGPESVRKRYRQQCEELRARLTASGDAAILEDNALGSVPDGVRIALSFRYDNGGFIRYDQMALELGLKHGLEETVRSGELHVINLVPLGADGNIPHHNMNPDDDLSWNPTLLELLRRIMDHKYAAPFINFDDEKRDLGYYAHVTKPRWFKFIEQGLLSDPSLGYGATAFFNDMLLLFHNPRRYARSRADGVPADPEVQEQADELQSYMEKLLGEMAQMGDVGEQLLSLYWGVFSLGEETWGDPEVLYFQRHYYPRSPSYDGTKPHVQIIRARAWEQLQDGQARVRELRRRQAIKESFRLEHGPSKRPREESVEELHHDGLERGPKRQRSNHSASPGPSNPDTALLRRTASKRTREPADNDGDGSDQETEQGEVTEIRAAKRQRLSEAVAPSSVPATSSGVSGSGPQAAPSPRPASKRARTPVDVDGDGGGDEHGDGGSHGSSGSKRRRLTKDTRSVGLAATSPEAGPSNEGKSSHKPAAQVSDSSHAHASSAAGQSAPQHPQHAAHSVAPSSQALNLGRNTVTMSKLAKMGKTRPWVFGYSSDEGDGIYTFMKCPGQNCKHHFSSHPLKDDHARDHLLSCGQPILDEQDMSRQYASQVVKDAGRKSGLTVEWARKSNMILLPSGQKDNHPDNFPLPPAGE